MSPSIGARPRLAALIPMLAITGGGGCSASPVEDTISAIDTAYRSGTPVAVAATIPAASFTLGSATLTAVRNLIVLHTANNVKAYQIIRVTFTTATA